MEAHQGIEDSPSSVASALSWGWEVIDRSLQNNLGLNGAFGEDHTDAAAEMGPREGEMGVDQEAECCMLPGRTDSDDEELLESDTKVWGEGNVGAETELLESDTKVWEEGDIRTLTASAAAPTSSSPPSAVASTLPLSSEMLTSNEKRRDSLLTRLGSVRRILEPEFCLQENYPRSLVVRSALDSTACSPRLAMPLPRPSYFV